MKNELKKTLAVLETLNKCVDEHIISDKYFEKKYQIINDLDRLDQESDKLINLLENTTITSFNKIMEQLCFLHMNLNNYAGYIDRISDAIKLSIDFYKEKTLLNRIPHD
ncbi:MAG TPA: hypothetical protein VLB80_01920 [Candidatus Babeliales bacterium]|nr:hypothetical protein [Candidatus Babeliales bacterium]